MTEAILEGGYAWEEEVVEMLDGSIEIAESDPDTPVRDRQFDVESSKKGLLDLAPGSFLYQPTLSPPPSFYERYGIDPEHVSFTECRPDLVQCTESDDGRTELRVIDIKASPGVKLSHRVQVTVYTMILESLLEAWGSDRRVSGSAGVWLAQREAPETFDVRSMRPSIERFFEEEVEALLTAPASEASWHLYYRCEWCEYFEHCREGMEKSDDVSRVPYLSGRAKLYVNGLDPPVKTVGEFADLLANPARRDEIDDCASLAGQQRRLKTQIDSLAKGDVATFGGYSAAMPRAEHVRLLLTLQNEPVSGQVYAWGLYGQGLKGVLDETPVTEVRVASSGDPSEVDELEREFVRQVHRILEGTHRFNGGEDDWKRQKTLQAYVFDSYERTLLVDLLLRRLQDASVAPEALALLFHFQQADLLGASDHPADVVFFPVVDLMRVVRSLFALPVEVTYRFTETTELLAPTERPFVYRDNDYYTFAFSNQMRSDAIFGVWYRGKDFVGSIEREIRSRLWATNSLINGIRERLSDEDALFAWPPKFQMPVSFDFRHEVLSRLAFLARYESVLRYLAVRESRMAPEVDREERLDVLRLNYRGEGWFESEFGSGEVVVEETTFYDSLLAADTPPCRRALLVYDDYRQRKALSYLPKKSPLHLAAPVEVRQDEKSTRIRLQTVAGQEASELEPGRDYLLAPRFTDFLSDYAIGELGAMDEEEHPWFVELIERPTEIPALGIAPEVGEVALELADQYGMTATQSRAFEQVLAGRLALVWGPPGTGKTHFLALAILCLFEAHRRTDREWRVLASSFTHTAIDNLLGKVAALQQSLGIYEAELPIGKLGRLDRQAPVGHIDLVDDRNVGWDWSTKAPQALLGGTAWAIRKRVDPEVADMVVLDEGSQLKLPEAAIAVRRLAPEGRLLIAGDDRQLPPIVQGAYPPPEDGDPLIHRSIFESLRDREGSEAYTTLLVENFRMNRTLCRYPALQLYSDDYDSVDDLVGSRRIALVAGDESDGFVEAVLDPEYPLVVVVSDGISAGAENRVEADLVARLAVALRKRLVSESGETYANDEEGDGAFWRDGLFVVSPHHAQIRAIVERLEEAREWLSEPFVGTVDRMQGQECDAVITSYGVADPEFAMSEKEFIYSLNRLNVAITRGRAKTIVFLSSALLEPPIAAFEDDETAEGIAFMQGLALHAERHGEEQTIHLGDGAKLSVCRLPNP